MKRAALVLLASLLLGSVSSAQQNPGDAPASKEDVQKYLDILQTRDRMKAMMDAFAKQMRRIVTDDLKKEPNVTPEMEDKAVKRADEMFKSLPIDELLDVMIPIYQKHLTKGNIDDLLAFYSTPTGQKLIKELPAITTEAMQAAVPIAQKMMADTAQRAEAEVAQAQKGSDPSSKKQTQQN